jgi:hypothetical protein
MAADIRVAALWNNRPKSIQQPQMVPQLRPKVGVPGTGVPEISPVSLNRDVKPTLPNSAQIENTKQRNIIKYTLLGLALIFLLHLARG